MKHFILISCLLLGCGLACFADPGTGMVMDSKGNLYYTDLKQVWMIRPDGTRSIAVANVHTHELYIDSLDRLYGEHLWYNGEQLNTWGHYVWCRQSDGVVKRIKDSTAGFLEDYSFTRDAQGNHYYVEKNIPALFWKREPSGNKTLLLSKLWSGIGRLHINPKGVLLFTHKSDVYALPPHDSLEQVVKDVGEINTVLSDSSGTIWNLWSDNRKNVYIATGTVIKKIDHRRLVTPIYKSGEGWYPVSGMVSSNGDFWVMEYNAANEVRVNKISAQERMEITRESRWKIYYLPLLVTTAVVVMLYFLFRSKKTAA